jgi:hypothetical protein
MKSPSTLRLGIKIQKIRDPVSLNRAGLFDFLHPYPTQLEPSNQEQKQGQSVLWTEQEQTFVNASLDSRSTPFKYYV